MDVRNITNAFCLIPRALLQDGRLSHTAKFLYCHMASLDTYYDNSTDNLALDLGMKKSEIAELLKELLKCGWICQSSEKAPNGKVARERFVVNDNNSARIETTITTSDDGGVGMLVKYSEDNNLGLKGKDSELKLIFDEFVTEYKNMFGTRCRTANTEFKDFINTHKDWREVIPILKPSIEIENNLRNEARGRNEFYPAPRDLKKYLGKDRAWEMYKESVDSYDSNAYNPKLDGINMSWDARFGCYIVPNFFGKVCDGYGDDNRPSDAMIFSNGVYYQWSVEKKKWIKKTKK